MDFEAHLKQLIADYADYDRERFTYENKATITFEIKQKIEAGLIALICQYLSQDGLTAEAIRSHTKKLHLLFHPDRYPVSSPQNKWLQSTLSSGVIKEAVCFNLVALCEKKLTNPEAPEFHYGNILTMEALKARIKRDRENAKTYTQRALLDSILAMLTSAEAYNDQLNNNISIIWAQRLTQLMPYLTTGYCLSFFIEELALLYAVTYTLSKGGRLLEQSSLSQGQTIGRIMRVFGETIFTAVTTLVARLTELNIFMVRGAINLGIDASGGIYKLLAAPVADGMNSPQPGDQSKALILAPQDLFGGMRFKTFELKILAMSLEQKSRQLQDQWFLDWRAGNYKNETIKKALRKLRVIDRSNLSVPEKLEKAAAIIALLESNKRVNVKGSRTEKTITMAKTLLELLRNSDAQEIQNRLAISV
ncbi:hypothetical protein [Legionella jamestowniensis]|uniref:J domain-containing protein n=1 Tax=Legionella jamestowniensis TaxID=455 RepID=A0A0W0UHV6_9GAMM|nr:hypothetical protein [Legionella jamestowniensis]KTD07161.1 hypothetical protein Ljam_1356 [Legionella jamestowniensis]OCH98888.1 hypothetical protein A8135_08995 [Legionella jamestowniensis]SFL71752.1 hypothetical protein SAMN02746073_1599 [Legionella jamestowniensis DSM 19215]